MRYSYKSEEGKVREASEVWQGRTEQGEAGRLSKQHPHSAKFICRRASQAGTWSTSVRQDEGSGAPGMLNRQGVVSGGDVL